jgi:hypothetical protein
MSIRRFAMFVSLALLGILAMLWWTQQRRKDQGAMLATGSASSHSEWLELD